MTDMSARNSHSWAFLCVFVLLLAGCDEESPKKLVADVYSGADVPPSACTEECVSPASICDEESGKCVQCLSDSQCSATGHCFDGFCMEEICVPGQSRCVGNQLEVCNEVGIEVSVVSCEGGPCVIDHCEECIPGTKACDGLTAKTCNDDGEYETLAICDSDQVCFNGLCLACVPGKTFCKNAAVYLCDLEGASSAFHEDCDTENTSLVCSEGECTDYCTVNVKFNTSIGCDYWAVDLDNAIEYPEGESVLDAQNAPFAVGISNPNETYIATVTVYRGNEEVEQVKVPPLQLREVVLPPLNIDGTIKGVQAYRLHSNAPINAYQFNPLGNVDVFSNDASMLMPQNSLGTEHIVMTRAQSQKAHRGYFTVVATEPGPTVVNITVTAKTLASEDGSILSYNSGESMSSITLEQGEVLNVESDQFGADLTGTVILTDRRVAVFGGSEAANVPTTEQCLDGICLAQGWPCETNEDCPVTCCADHLEQQLPPVSVWGEQYLASRSQPRGKAPDVWRVVASQDGTTVSTIPFQHAIPTLDRGEWAEFQSEDDFLFLADKPILVGQFLASEKAPFPNNDTCEYFETSLLGTGNYCKEFVETGVYVACEKHSDCPNIDEQDDAKIGDPAFILSVPYEQYRDDYVFLVPDAYSENYINIAAPVFSTVFLSNEEVPEALFSVVGNGFFKVARVPVEAGVHRVKSDQRIGVIVYGWSKYVSYGYPAGQNLDVLSF